MARLTPRLPAWARRQSGSGRASAADAPQADAEQGTRKRGRLRMPSRASLPSGGLSRNVRLVIWLVVIAFLVLVPGRWARNLISDRNAETDQINSEISVLEAQVTRSETLEAGRSDYARAYEALLTAMPASPELPEAIDQIAALEARTGARVENLGPAAPLGAGTSEVLEINLSLTLRGSETSVTEFIDGLRSLPRLVVVDSVGLTWEASEDTTGAATASGGQQLQATIDARMFAWPRGASAQSP